MRNLLACIAVCLLISASASAEDASSTDPLSGYPAAVRALPRCSAKNACPAGVDKDFVRTPSGWFHPSCIVPISNDETYDVSSGIVRHEDGTTRKPEACNHLPRDRDGNAFSPAQNVPSSPTIDGWLATIWNDQNVGAVSGVNTNWTVPSTPVTGNATIYFFPGLQNSTILQPVLAYNGNDGTGGLANGWTITSWDCCDANNHNIMSNTPIAVNPGDSISGNVQGRDCNYSTGICPRFTVLILDNDTSQYNSVTISGNTQIFGTAAHTVVGGALEVYDVDTCSQMPSSTKVTFNNVLAQYIDGIDMTPSDTHWSNYTVSASPNCLPDAYRSRDSLGYSNQYISWWPSDAPQKPSSPGSPCGTFTAGEGLKSGESSYSCDRRFRLTLSSSNGGAYLYQDSTVLWSNTSLLQVGRPADSLVMQSDGNFVRYSPTTAKWASNSSGNSGAYLSIQNDGNLVVYSSSGGVLWASNTCCH